MNVKIETKSGQTVVWIDGKKRDPHRDIPNSFTNKHKIKTFLAVRLELGSGDGGVPKAADCVKGICYVNRKRSQPFTAAEIELVRFVSRLAAIVIEFARQEARSQMGAAARTIAKMADPQTSQEALLAEIVKQACELIGAPAGCLWLTTGESSNLLRPLGRYGLAAGLKKRIPVANSITGKFLASGKQSDFEEDVLANEDYYAKEEATAADLRSLLLVRLLVHGEARGALNVYTVGAPRAFGPWHESLLCSFAGLCSIVIDLHEAGRQQMEVRDNLLKMAGTLYELRDLESIVQTAADQAREIADADCAYMYPYNPATGQFLPNRVSTKPEKTEPEESEPEKTEPEKTKLEEIKLRTILERRRPRGAGLSRKIVRTGKTIKVPDTSQSNEVNRQTPELGIQSLVGFPVKHSQRIVGVLYVDFKEKEDFEEAEEALKFDTIELLLPLAAVAIENAHLSHELKRERAKCDVQIVLRPLVDHNQWNGYIQAQGALFGAAFFQIDWNRPSCDLATDVDAIGLKASCNRNLEWKDDARRCGATVAAILRGESRDVAVLGGEGQADMARILANAFDPQLVPETKLSFRIPSELMAFPFEFAHHRDYWVMDYAMSRFLVDADQIHRESFESFLKDLVFGPARQKLRVLLIADTDNLPGTKTEAKAVLKILRRTLGGLVVDVVLAGGEATPDRVVEELRQQKYDVVHFAGHGEFNHNAPEKSLLRLGDRGLEARRFAWYLQQSGTKFLYLSSCWGGTP